MSDAEKNKLKTVEYKELSKALKKGTEEAKKLIGDGDEIIIRYDIEKLNIR